MGAFEYVPVCTQDSDCTIPPECQTAAGATCADQQCSYPALPADTPCDDGQYCTQGDLCDANGNCLPGTSICGEGGPEDGGPEDGGIDPGADRAGDGGGDGQSGGSCGCQAGGRDGPAALSILVVMLLGVLRRRQLRTDGNASFRCPHF